MREVKTINLKVNALDKAAYTYLMEQCKLLYNDFTQWAYDSGTYNKNKAHWETYERFKIKYPDIKIALHQSTGAMALENCKRQKLKGKMPQKKTMTLRLDVNCYTLRGRQLTLIGISKRHKEILHIPDYYKTIFETWDNKGATLSYDKKTKQFWIHITFCRESSILQKPKDDSLRTLGIDRGINNIVATSAGQLISSMHIQKIKTDYAYLRSKLQKKGTRSAKRLLRQRSRKEKRFVLDSNHCIAKKLANSNYDVFVLEKLKGLKTACRKGKKFNKKLFGWSYFQLQTLLTYKAQALGKHVVYVDPKYTSQQCSACGHVDKESRQASVFICTSCGHTTHADLNAALNIKQKHFKLLALPLVGAAVNQPYASAVKLDASR